MGNDTVIDLLSYIKYVERYIKRNLVWISGLFILGVGLSSAYFYYKKDVFSWTLSYTSVNHEFVVVEEMFQPISDLIREKNYQKLAIVLKVAPEEVNSLDKSKIKAIKVEKDLKIKSAFVIEFESGSREVKEVMNESLTNYFNSLPIVEEYVGPKRESLERLKASIEMQMTRLDSMQRQVERGVSSGQFSGIQDLGLGFLYDQMANMGVKLDKAEEDLLLLKEFKLVAPQSVVHKKGITYFLLLGIAIGLFLNLVMFVIVGYRKLTRESADQEGS